MTTRFDRLGKLVRRGGRSLVGGGGAAPFDPLDLVPIRYLVGDSAYITTDGGGDVTNWEDQSTAARDYSGVTAIPTYVASDAGLNNQGSLDFAAASSESLREVDIPTDIRILHNGVGGTFVAVLDNDGAGTTQTIFQTLGTATSASTGLFLRYSGAGSIRALVGNSSGIFVSDITGSVAAGSAGILVWRMKSGESPAVDMRWNGVSIASSAITGSPASGNPTGTPRIGANATPAQGYDGRIAAVAVFPWLNASQVTQLEDFLAAKYGL